MTTRVELGNRSYPIIVAKSYEALPAALSQLGLGKHGVIISHASLLKRYGSQLEKPLAQAGWQLSAVTVPESEASKSLETVRRVVAQVAKASPMRVPVLLAFGGGVVGDLAGFVAAVYRRGVPYVQLPTTLLAQVDSAIGGKVAVDLPEGKNLVGAFYQPRLVWNQTALLNSLPARQIRSGLSEIIKYGVIADPVLFRFLENNLASCLALRTIAVQTMIRRSCAIKAHAVSKDERETRDVRITLNFGHTLGHAIEAATGYRSWTHGEAIAVGMAAASRMAVLLGMWPEAAHTRLEKLFKRAALPTRAIGVSVKAVMRAMRYDKKFTQGSARWVLPTRLGKVVVREGVSADVVARVVAEYLSKPV